MDPISNWFSYGSNLYGPDFESKMRKYGSSLSLLCPLKATLKGWKRRLNNISDTRGLAYSITNDPESIDPDSHVDGVLHVVPIADLPAFLRFEGVLDSHFELKKSKERRYDIQGVSPEVWESGNPENCFTLKGITKATETEIDDLIRTYYHNLKEYVQTAKRGAACFEINTSCFQEDLDRIKKLKKRVES